MVIEAVLAGLFIGAALGALGGGGGVLAVPVLVYLLGQTPQDATTSSLVVVGITAAVGAASRLRSGLVHWRTGLLLVVPGIPAAYLGTVVNRHVDGSVLLLAFAVLIVGLAVVMLTSAGPGDGPTRSGRSAAGIGTAATAVAAGLLVGFLTGLLGVGGGFLAVPALVIVLRMPMPAAIGTSLLVIAVNSATALLARSGVDRFDWAVIVPFTAAAIVGTAVGTVVADRVSGRSLTRAFAVLLVSVAGFVAVQSALALP